MTNEELVEAIQVGQDVQSNMGILYEQNRGFIFSLVKRFTEYAEIDDLMQEAYFGLVSAVDSFDTSCRCKFLTYLSNNVRWKIIRYIQYHSNTKRVSASMQERITKYKKLIATLGYIPTDDEAMKEINLTKQQYDLMVKTMYEMECVSLDAVLGEDDMTVEDTISDGTDFEEDSVDTISLSGIWSCVDELQDDRRKTIILKRYKDNQTLDDIASDIGVSRDRVRQIEQSALKEMKYMEKIQSLAETFDYNCSLAYKSGVQRMKDGKGSNVEYIAMKHLEYQERQQKSMERFRKLMMIG